MLIRDECSLDEDAIQRLTIAAFAPMKFSDGSEAPIIRALRHAGDLTISLVAENEGAILGHIAFSPITIDETHNHWFGLGPISVRPDVQRTGIGKALILQGLDRLRTKGARGCALIGDPVYYRKLGFESDGRLTYGQLRTELVQRIVFIGTPPQGAIRFTAAFDLDHSANP